MRMRSLRAMTIAFIAITSLATIFTAIAVYFAIMGAIDAQVDKRLTGEAAQLLAGQPSLDRLQHRIGQRMGRRDSADIGFLLRDSTGRRLAGNVDPTNDIPKGFSTVDGGHGIVGLTRGRALLTPLASDATLTLIAESEPIDNHDRQRVRILGAGFGTILIVLIAGSLVLSRSITRRIDALRNAAEAIVDGDMKARVPIDGTGGPFERQAAAFNHMLDRIGELMASLAGMSNDIAHDLRTPLARLHGRLSALANAPAAESVRDQLLAATAQSEEILSMFAAILRITEVEGGDRRAFFTRIDIADLVQQAGTALDAMVEDSGRHLHVETTGPLFAEGDERLLSQALVNLIENAVTHTPAATEIRVHAHTEHDRIRITVSDNGPGIPSAEHSHVLRRFGRLETSRHRPGHGLGLPLVLAIARLHRGNLTLADAAPGLAVHIDLPCTDG